MRLNKCRSVGSIKNGNHKLKNTQYSINPQNIRTKSRNSLISSTKTNSFKLSNKNGVPLKPTTAASQTITHQRRIESTPKNFEDAISENIMINSKLRQNAYKKQASKCIQEPNSKALNGANLNHRIISLKSRNCGAIAAKTSIKERREQLKKEIISMHFGNPL